MSEDNPGMVYGQQTFVGVRFVLLGFDAVSKNEFRSKLLVAGGTDVGRYGPECTHVIVDKIIYDDPICVAARRDGKAVVTSLWVDHSFEVGMPVDINSVIYRPLRDLNGISGANSLVVCLTGYQRHDREDIMIMVELMGASFSKPLVASKVTHLVCYKFEGEKYELAKKMEKIKIVNHCWLEDCLRAWDILPEADYNRSSYELEMMEAEAKDSEDEREDMAMKPHSDRKVVASPQNFRIEMRSPHHSFAVEPEVLRTNTNSSIIMSGPDNCNAIQSVARKNMTTGPTSCMEGTQSKNGDQPNSPDAQIFYGISGFPFDRHDDAVTPEKVSDDLASTSKTAEMSLHTDVSNLSAKSHSRSLTKASPPMCSAQRISNVGSLNDKSSKQDVTDGFNLVSSTAGHDETTSSDVRTPVRQYVSHPEELQSTKLPEKRKSTVSGHSAKWQKKSHGTEALTPSSDRSGPCEKVSCLSPSKGTTHIEENDLQYPQQVSPVNVSKAAALVIRPGSNEGALQTSSKKWKTPFSDSNVDNVEQNDLQDLDVHASGEMKTDIQKSSGLVVSSDLPREVDLNSHRKPARTKMLSRKVSGSSSRFGKGGNVNKKGSIYPNKLVTRNDSGVNSFGDKDEEDHENIVESERVKPSHATGDKNMNSPVQRSNIEESHGEIPIKVGSLDEETEALENKGEDEFYVAVHKDEHEGVDGASEDKLISSAGAKQHDPIMHEDRRVTSDKENSKSKAVCGGRIEVDGSTSMPNILAERTDRGKKRSFAKTKNPSKATKSVNIGNTMGQEFRAVGSNNTKTAKKEKDSSTGADQVDKENFPVLVSDKGDEECTEKVKSNSKKKPSTPELDNRGILSPWPEEQARTNLSDPVWFILSGHKFQRKEFQQVIKRLKGRVCRDSHHWSYQATHLVFPDPIRRTEKFFAAAASGRWILKTEYLTASKEAGKFLPEHPYEWHENCLSEDGAINLAAPRKWRLLRERTGHGAFYGMRVIVYGEFIAPPLDTLKRAVKAGDGTILATSPPYTRFLQSGVDFAIVSPGMLRADMWIQEFLRHEIPCVSADYLVEYVCKPGYSLDKHVQYGTHSWADNSLKNMVSRMEEIIKEQIVPEDDSNVDIPCEICGSRDRGEVMLICGDERGLFGCGIGTHIDCCDPPLQEVPVDDWFCPKCRKTEYRAREKPSTKKGKSKTCKL